MSKERIHQRSTSHPENRSEEKVNDGEQLLNMLNEFDADEDGCLNWEEFCKLCQQNKIDDQQCEKWWHELGGISRQSKIAMQDIVAKFTMTSV